ncbi:hypothetical protein C2G38_2034210 [Gigaspora rosea]|uniref:Uncharacterized protein n=1 Tax=Gigaspora rosea TaxID=44941 RepID=A0A397VKV3_9GLOM|nr:hypothetical protein C2G38_2034210 [Gigaspora rosea]
MENNTNSKASDEPTDHAAITIDMSKIDAIAIGNYVDLAEFEYKSLKANMKYNDKDHSLQTSKNRVIAIRKRSRPQKFTDISLWLLTFRAYMEAILIIYDLKEQELNAYQDHINTLCIKQEFSAIATYNEDRHLHLTTNHDSTLFEQNIEVEGENFDVTTTKKQRTIANPRNAKEDITWQDRRQICINWNCKGCPMTTTANEYTPVLSAEK